MPTVINTNLASLYAQNNLANAQNNLAQSVQRLSSGLRINSAKDDAAGLSITQNMQSQINGTNQSVRNLNDATNLLQVADTSLGTIQDMLLRLKQLATQGYDGSLSAAQKLSIVQEMKELNSEINTTAARTAFNGINLLSQGGSTDMVNSDIKAGAQVVTTAITASTGANKGILLDGTLATPGGGTSTATVSVTLDPDYLNRLPGTYTFSKVGNQLTLTGTMDGQATSQTVTVADAPSDFATSKTTQQVLNFDRFGIKLNLSATADANDTITGAELATAIVAEGTAAADQGKLYIAGVASQITATNVSGAAAGNYTITSPAAGQLKMAGTINGQSVEQTVTLAAGVANTTQTVNFSAFGIQFDVKSYSTDSLQTAAQIATAIAALNTGTNAGAGTFVVSQGANSALKFQSGPNSDAFIQINTLNVQTAATGVYAGTATDMLALGTRIAGTAAGNLGGLTAGDSIDVWQTAFKNAALAVDGALEYISTQRGVYGAQMNRLSYVSTNLQSQSTNLQNSRSAIIDTDFAAETARLTRGQIMQQAATAMLAQANQMPNVVLSLLK
jgi:flagellin